MLNIPVYADPQHSWAKVPNTLLYRLGIADKITPYSYVWGNSSYLEEDCDVSTLVKALKEAKIEFKFTTHYARNESRIRSYPRYSAENIAAQTKTISPGMVLLYGNKKYKLVEPALGPKGAWYVDCEDGYRYRMMPSQIKRAYVSAE